MKNCFCYKDEKDPVYNKARRHRFIDENENGAYIYLGNGIGVALGWQEATIIDFDLFKNERQIAEGDLCLSCKHKFFCVLNPKQGLLYEKYE